MTATVIRSRPFHIFAVTLLILIAITNTPASANPGASHTANPTSLHVHPNGSDNNPGTPEQPLQSIETALTRAAPGTIIRIATAEYRLQNAPLRLRERVSLEGGYSLDWQQRDRERFPTIITDPRIIGGSSENPIHTVYAAADISSETSLAGLIIQAPSGNSVAALRIDGNIQLSDSRIRGGIADKYAYGIYIGQDSSAGIHECHIDGNHSSDQAAGIYLAPGSSAVIADCSIHGGVSTAGVVHAIYARSAHAQILRNRIYGGHCEGDQCYTAGIREAQASGSLIMNNAIHGGTGYRAYAIVTSDGSDPLIYNNTLFAGNPIQTAIGIYIKNDDNPRIINNLIFTGAGRARYCIYENDPGSFPGHPNPDSNPGILRNNNLFDCPTALLSWFNEQNTSWHAVHDLFTPITSAEDGTGSMADWNNLSEDISDYLDTQFQFNANPQNVLFDTAALNGSHPDLNWPYQDDIQGTPRSPLGSAALTGWSMGAFEINQSALPNEDVNRDGTVDELDIVICRDIILDPHNQGNNSSRCDINSDSRIDTLDLQRIIYAMLNS